MPEVFQPGVPITVKIISRPNLSVLNYALEDKPPEGWMVLTNSISYGGAFDALRGKVKWGPFFENTPRTNLYQVVPDTNTVVKFVGGAAFDGQTADFIGERFASPDLTNFFAVRHLPTSYSPGLKMTVILDVNPPPGVSFYKIEDTVPPPSAPGQPRWMVSNVSHDGVADINGVVRFGPFLDDAPRRLTYEVTPPLSVSGAKTFTGIAFADGGAHLLAGDSLLDLVPLHPADISAVDGWITIGEVTAYVAAWKDGGIWPSVGADPPGLVRNDFLERAVELWLGGEGYWYDDRYATPPLWWTSVLNPPSGIPAPQPLPAGTAAANGTAIASMPLVYQPGTKLTVTIAVTPASSVIADAVEDQPPAGWSVGAISEGGFLDVARGKVKWGPFFDSGPRTLSYEVTPPAGATNLVRFNGAAAFDNQQGAIGGQRFARPKPTDFFAVRHLPASYSPGLPMTVILDVNPPAGVSFYKIEDRVPSPSPELWTVSNISHDGVGVEDLGEVRFGPFLDDLPRRLTYELTAPLCVSGSKTLAGIAYADGSQRLLVGDYLLDMVPLHPADTNSVDGWVTIGEVTKYVTAWKRGEIWPCVGPDPEGIVRNDFLERAVELWLGGEHYGFDPAITNAPLWWVNLTNSVLQQDVPIAVVPGSTTTSGTASVSMTNSFLPGVPISIRITATPGPGVSAYALEDQPPEGWTVLTNSISEGGRFDALRGKVKWGPFSDDTPRTNSYQVIAPLDAGEVGRFVGGVAFDGQTADFIGPRETMRNGNPPPRFSSVRLLSGGLELTLQGGGVGIFTIQRSPDLIGWSLVGTIPTSGGPVVFVDSSATNRTWTFYRAVWQ